MPAPAGMAEVPSTAAEGEEGKVTRDERSESLRRARGAVSPRGSGGAQPPGRIRKEAGGRDIRRDVTEDALFEGAVRFRQPASGYRVNVDAILLAAFASVGRRAGLCVDLGAGVGAIALALHHLGAVRELALVDREHNLCTLARENLLRAGAEGTVYRVDLEDGLPEPLSQAADLVVANPPFYDPKHHRPSKDRQRERARMGTITPFTEAAARALSGTKARALFAYPAPALAELVRHAQESGLIPKRLRFVHARKDEPARIALVEFRRARPGGLVVEPPLFEWQAPKIRSEEVNALLGRSPRARRSPRIKAKAADRR
jgi:tRNA1(Val) A37 N6-methylase TrmN6